MYKEITSRQNSACIGNPSVWHPIAHHHDRCGPSEPMAKTFTWWLVKKIEKWFAMVADYRTKQIRRNEVERLARLSDDQLKDIGLSRADLHSVTGLPLSVDVAHQLEQRRALNKYHL